MKNKKTKMLYLTGTRADYGVMRRTLLSIDKLCCLELIVTNMHLEKKFGYTINEVRKDKLKISQQIKLPHKSDEAKSYVKNLGYLLTQLSEIVAKSNPDCVLIEGDRAEMLAMTITASAYNIPIIHQGGGDDSGTIDDKIRNAITSFSDYHLAGSLVSAQKLKSMGILPERIFMFGEPGLDDIAEDNFSTPTEIRKKYNIDKNKKLILLVQHPDTEEKISPAGQVKPSLEVIKKMQIPTIIGYPNNDPGGRAMIKEIKKYEKLPFIQSFASVPRSDYLGILKICDLMIGNSSGGLIETPMFNLPFINVGNRQKGRLTDVNVAPCGYNSKEIAQKIKKNINKKGTFRIKHVWGKGDFTKKFIGFFLTKAVNK